MASDDATTLIVKSSKFLGRKLVVDAVPVTDAVIERRRRQRARQTLLASRRSEVGLAEGCHAFKNIEQSLSKSKNFLKTQSGHIKPVLP